MDRLPRSAEDPGVQYHHANKGVRLYTRKPEKRYSLTGVTNNLKRRIYEHKSDLVEGFTKDHQVHTLVYFEQSESMYAAIEREKRIKHWDRKWKLRIIEEMNPNWRDLYSDL